MLQCLRVLFACQICPDLLIEQDQRVCMSALLKVIYAQIYTWHLLRLWHVKTRSPQSHHRIKDPRGFDPPAWRSGIARTIHAMLRVHTRPSLRRSKTLCIILLKLRVYLASTLVTSCTPAVCLHLEAVWDYFYSQYDTACLCNILAPLKKDSDGSPKLERIWTN